MAADQSGLPPFFGSEDWSKNLGINARNPFNLPQQPSPFVAHFYPLVNPHRGAQTPGQPGSAFAPPSESILSSIATGRADFLCNELYKNLLSSAARFDPKLQIKGDHFPVPAPLESLRSLNGKFDAHPGQLIQRNQIRNFYESLRQKLTPRNHLLATGEKINQRADSRFNWCGPGSSHTVSRHPPFPFGPAPDRNRWSANSSKADSRFCRPQPNRRPDPPVSPAISENTFRAPDMKDSEPEENRPASLGPDDSLRGPVDRFKRKRKHPFSADTCPVCGITVRASELKQHFVQEMSKLEKIPLEVYRKQYSYRKSGGAAPKPATTSSKKHDEVEDKSTSRKLNRQKIIDMLNPQTFQKVRTNRIDRFNSRVGSCRQSSFAVPGAGGEFRDKVRGVLCPICNASLSHLKNYDELSEHVVACSGLENGADGATGRSEPGSPTTVDVDGDCGRFEEYEWCGETRIRATSLVNRELLESVPGFHVIRHGDETDQDLDVESDETRDFGSTQFTDDDLLPVAASDEEPRNGEIPVRDERPMTAPCPQQGRSNESCSPALVTQALRMKIHELEGSQPNRCLICMSPYESPLVSIQCWHVHCKKCWLRALGVKKLCPQCNMITPASQLRRIYL